MSFLIPLAIALAGLAAFAVLVVGLTSAPWPVLLLLIVLVLVSSQRLMGSLQKAELPLPEVPLPPEPESKSEKEEILIYRGNTYKYAPMTFGVTREVDEVEYNGKYRGLPWKSPRKKQSSE